MMTGAPTPSPLSPPSIHLPPPAEQTYDNAIAALFSPLHQSQTPDEIRRAAQRRTRTPGDMRRYLSRISLPHGDKSHCPNIVHITGTKGKGSTAATCESVLRLRDGLTTGLFTSPHLVDIRERIRICGRPVSKEVFADAYWEIRRRFEEWKKDADDEDDGIANDDGLPFLPGYFRMLSLMAAFIFAHYVSPGGKRIDVVILEVGVGGRYDGTNIFDHTETNNTVCGVTLIDYDHTRVLGNALSQIAWEKGGVFCSNKGNIVDVFADGFDASQHNITARPEADDSERAIEDKTYPAQNENTRFYTISSNPKEVIRVLRSCAFKEGTGQSLGVVTAGDVVQPEWKISLPGDHQRLNAELAVALSNALIKNFVQVNDTSATPSNQTTSIENALSQTFWPGRCQTVPLQVADGQTPISMRCDGAHTPQSLATCLEWFRTVSGYDSAANNEDDEEQERKCPRFLLFNCSHERNPIPLLQMIQAIERKGRPLFDQVYFCRADSERPSALKKASARELLVESGILKDNGNSGSGDDEEEPTSWQDTLANVWMALAARSDSSGLLEVPCVTNVTVGDALDIIKHSLERNQANTGEIGTAAAEVCVTGSLYMVGSVLNAAEWTEPPCDGHLAFDSKKVGAS